MGDRFQRNPTDRLGENKVSNGSALRDKASDAAKRWSTSDATLADAQKGAICVDASSSTSHPINGDKVGATELAGGPIEAQTHLTEGKEAKHLDVTTAIKNVIKFGAGLAVETLGSNPVVSEGEKIYDAVKTYNEVITAKKKQEEALKDASEAYNPMLKAANQELRDGGTIESAIIAGVVPLLPPYQSAVGIKQVIESGEKGDAYGVGKGVAQAIIGAIQTITLIEGGLKGVTGEVAEGSIGKGIVGEAAEGSVKEELIQTPSAKKPATPVENEVTTGKDTTSQDWRDEPTPPYGHQLASMTEHTGSTVPGPPHALDTGFGSFEVTWRSDPRAIVKFEPFGDGVIVSDIARGNHPPGSAGGMLAEALRKVKHTLSPQSHITQPRSIEFSNVIHEKTAQAWDKGTPGELTTLGRTLTNAVSALDGTITDWQSWRDDTGRLHIKVAISYRR